MKKDVLTTLIALSLLFFSQGCSTISGVSAPFSSTSASILREAELTSKWRIMQMSLRLDADKELPILIKLADGDRVDGYFYLEKGNNVDFQVMANSLVYKPQPQSAAAGGMSGDRFAFTASTAQGSSYTLTFRNAAPAKEKQAGVTVFLELIYPSTGAVFTRLDEPR